MKTEHSIEFGSSLSTEQILSKALFWGKSCGFVPTRRAETEIVLERGSPLANFYSLNIDRYPTVLTIRVDRQLETRVSAKITARTWAVTMITHADKRKISELIDAMPALLGG